MFVEKLDDQNAATSGFEQAAATVFNSTSEVSYIILFIL